MKSFHVTTALLTIASVHAQGLRSSSSSSSSSPTSSSSSSSGSNDFPPTTDEQPTCRQVSVVGDATFCIDGPVCSGGGDQPAGTNCPKTGDIAVADCLSYLPSASPSGQCQAPVNAQCQYLSTGVWGCVWPSSSSSSSGSAGSGVVGSSSGSAEVDDETIRVPMSAMLKSGTSSSSSDANGGTSAGVIIGVVAGVACVGAAIAGLQLYNRRRERAAEIDAALLTPGVAGSQQPRQPQTPPLWTSI